MTWCSVQSLGSLYTVVLDAVAYVTELIRLNSSDTYIRLQVWIQPLLELR